MSRRDNVNKLYRIPNNLDVTEHMLYIINLIAAIISLSSNQKVMGIAIIVQIVAAVFYFVISAIDDGYFWYEAEKARRRNSIENGLGTRLSELETKGYYNNQSKESLEKYALNTLESNLFSKEIAGKMIFLSCIKSAIAVVILIVACRFMTDSELLLIISQTAFSSYILLDTVMLVLYKLRMDGLYKEGYALLISPGVKERKKKAGLLAYSVEYEAIKAHYKIRISEKVFKKNNEILSNQWEQVLSHYRETKNG